MGDIVNLRRARKARVRQVAEDVAAVNRAAHGRSSAEKTQTAALRRLEARRLDGHSTAPEPIAGVRPLGPDDGA